MRHTIIDLAGLSAMLILPLVSRAQTSATPGISNAKAAGPAAEPPIQLGV